MVGVMPHGLALVATDIGKKPAGIASVVVGGLRKSNTGGRWWVLGGVDHRGNASGIVAGGLVVVEEALRLCQIGGVFVPTEEELICEVCD